jgi:hypothetical protein
LEPQALGALASASGGWLSAVLCALASGWHVRRLQRHAPPALESVRAELARAPSETEKETFRAELRARKAEAERALSLATLLPRSLARVALASGTALALTSLAKQIPAGGAGSVAPAAFGFVGGIAGMVACTAFGRQAKSLASQMRQHWKDTARAADGQWTRGKASG